MIPRNAYIYLFFSFMVELSLPRSGGVSTTGTENAITITASATQFGDVSRCSTSSPSAGFTWPKPRQLADRKERNQLQKIMNDNNYMGTWNPDDPASASDSRWRLAVDALPNSVRKAILNLTQTEDIIDSDLQLLNTSVIAMFQKELNRLLTDDQVIGILRGFLQKQQFRHAAQVIERFASRMTNNPDFFISLWNDQQIRSNKQCDKDVQTFLRQGLRLLPPLEDWNRTIVRKYGFGFISSLPPDVLIKIRDPEAGKMILDRWLSDKTFGCGIPPDSTDSLVSVARVQVKLMMTALGDIRAWKMDDLNRYSYLLNRLSPRSLAMIDGQVLIGSLSLLSQVKHWKDGQGYAIVNRILFNNSSRLDIVTTNHLAFILDRLNGLAPYFLPEYLNKTQPDLFSVWANKMESFSQRATTIPRLTASALLHYRLSKIENVDLMSAKNLSRQLDVNYLKVAPWKLWKLTLAQSDSVINKGLLQRLAVDRSAGSLSDGQITRLSAIAARLFRKANFWNIAGTPVPYWGGVNLSEYSSVPSKEVQSIIDRISWAADKMSGGQLGIIYTKLQQDQADLLRKNSIQVIKAMIPVPSLGNSSYQLQTLASDMPADSIVRLAYAASKLKNPISVKDLTRQPLLVAHLTPEHIKSIPLSDTPYLLEAVSLSAQAPAVQTVRALQVRLKDYTKLGRVDVTNNDISLLDNVWFSNYDIYPATVLTGFSLDAFKAVAPLKKVGLLRSLGQLSLIDYYTVPKKKRQAILKEGLHALNKDVNGELNEEDLAVIGNAVVDLDETSLTRLSAQAFENALPILQGDVDIFSGLTARPCLSADQRSGIRRALISIYGSPSTWSLGTVAMACCSLDTLSQSELEAIRDDFILDGCQSCLVDFSPSIHLRVLHQNIQTACQYELDPKEPEAVLPVGNEVIVKRRALAAFKTYRRGTLTLREINKLPGNETAEQLSCEEVVASGSGAGFTVDQLESLSDEDIRDCLYELGSSLLSRNQAKALWNRILQSYGSANKIPIRKLTQLGWILVGVDMASFQIIRLNDSDVLTAFGTADRQISTKKMEVLSNRVAVEWKQGPQFYTGQDLMILGRLLCGMNASHIEKIPKISYLEASAFLGMILYQPGCSNDVLMVLANKAVTVFGPPADWTPAIVRNVGAVIGGLSPELLRLIPSDSLVGLTPNAVTSIPNNYFQAFKTKQLRNFPLAAAQTMTKKRSELVAEMNDALDYVIYGDSLENSSERDIGNKIYCIIVAIPLIRLWF